MSCPKCAGNGRYYTEEYAGVWKINPCLCSYSMTVRQARELEFKNLREKIRRLKNA